MSTIETSLVQDKKESNHITCTSEEISEVRTSNPMRQMNVKKLVTQVQFLLCPSCYWCASYIGLQRNMNSILTHCIACKNNKIESYQFRLMKVIDLITVSRMEKSYFK
jgi:hypothetical protein